MPNEHDYPLCSGIIPKEWLKPCFDDFREKHAGKTGYVIGKGPSLDEVGCLRAHFNLGVVLCCNESIHKIEDMKLTAPLYVVQQDSHLKDKCVPRDETTIHLMNCYQLVSGKTRKVTKSEWNANAVLYDPCVLGMNYTSYTAIMACRIAKYMGIEDIVFVCFDSWAQGGSTEYAACIDRSVYASGVVRSAPVPKIEVVRQAREMGLKLKAWFPDVEV